MTAQLPHNLLQLFAPRPPLRYLPPNDHAPEDRKTAQIDGVAQFLPQLKEEFGDYKPTESWLEMKDRTRLEKQAHEKWFLGDGFKELFNPKEDKNIRGDPYKTLFVSRLSYDTDTKDLEKEFGRFGPIERVRVPLDTGEHNPKNKGKPLGYAFIVFERERDMKAAYKETENLRIKGRKVVVDVERGRTVNGWRPRKFGGGLGGRGYTQAPAPKPMGFGPPMGPGGFGRGGGFRGGFDGGRGGFRGGRGGPRGGGGFDRGGGGRFGDRGYGAPDGAPAGPRSGGGYGGRDGGRGFDDRGSRSNANLEPLPPRGGDRGGDRYRDRDRDSAGGYAGQKRPYDGGGNGTIESIKDIVHKLNDAKVDSNTEVVISPPALYLLLTREHARKGIEVAAQNVFDKPNGAFTGEISVEQLKDSNITWTLLGHSERRVILQESDSFIANKTKTAIDGGISVILCCGETLEQRDAGKTMEVVINQLAAVSKQVKDWSKIVVAYEPVWAIGTGKVATTEQAQEVHKGIREWLNKELGQSVADSTRIIYGGSVSEKNCRDLAKEADIDGFLVGGASLKPAFVDIINAKQ